MASRKQPHPKPRPLGVVRRRSKKERASYFARREAAKILRIVLRGEGRSQNGSSIKALVYSPTISNKKATFALVCETLKHLQIIKAVLESASALNSKWKKQQELIYVVTYDILFGKENMMLGGDAERFMMHRKNVLHSSLARLLVQNKVKHVSDLFALYNPPDVSRPCYVRVNTLKLDLESAMLELRKKFVVRQDDLLPDLLQLPPHSDLHDHPLLLNGSVFIQGKASSMVAVVLDPKPGWEVLDACSAPGNKTVHLAALMKGKGRIIACELHENRIERLKETIRLSGATNIEVLHDDFLSLDPKKPSFSKIRAVLVDPSCSGSGTAAQRLDHLLPSHEACIPETQRLKKLATFQKKALSHAFSFPSVERVVYSTCSVHQVENEDVISSVLVDASYHGFCLATPFPHWPHRGLKVFDGCDHLLRMDPTENKEGFFIALFVKTNNREERRRRRRSFTKSGHGRRKFVLHCLCGRICKGMLWRAWISRKRKSRN